MRTLTHIEEKYVKDVYECIADKFDNTRGYKWNWIEEFLSKQINNSIIYDLGCGNGRNMFYKNLKFIGVDNCTNFLKICKNKNLDVIEANITNIPLKNNSADAIICIAVFHQLSNYDNRIKALLEFKRLIKPEGKILLSVWSKKQPAKTRRTFDKYGDNIVLWNNYGTIYERYYYIFKIDEIKSLFKKTGLKLINNFHDCGNEIFILTK